MEESEKELLEILKNFDFQKLLMKKTYVDLQINEAFKQSFIIEQKESDKFELFIKNYSKKEVVPINFIYFFNENEYTEEEKKRDYCINDDLFSLQTEQIIDYIIEKLKIFSININPNKNKNSSKKGYNKKISRMINSSLNKIQLKNLNDKNKIPDKNGRMIDITGYQTFQFFCGYILDCLTIIKGELLKGNLDDSLTILFILILDIFISLGELVKLNLKKYKTAYYNRKLLIVSQIHAILI